MKTKKWMLVFSVISQTAFMLSMGAATARAAAVCETVDDCRALQAQVEARLAKLSKKVMPNLTDIVRNADGSVRNMSQYDAEVYCKSQGERLPTARELALYSQSLGAKGISETNKNGYTLVKGSDPAGNPDLFYFNNDGYQRPAGDLENHLFWSSSVHHGLSNDAYCLFGDDGVIGYGYRINVSYFSAVRCVRAAR